MMTLEHHVPAEPLRDYVGQMIYFEGYSAAHSIERFVPDGSVDLVIDMTDEDKFIFDNASLLPLQSCRASWVSGMRSAYISITAGGTSMMVVNFRAAGAGPFFHVPLHELADRVVDAESVLGPSIRGLRDRIRLLRTASQRFGAVESWLSRRLRTPKNGHRLAATAAALIDASPQIATIESVAATAGVSTKHLVHVFREYAGLTPKQYQRIRRFQVVVSSLEAEKSVDWARVALECGFCDQSHLIREFSHFCGMTPAQYMESKGQELNYIPVA